MAAADPKPSAAADAKPSLAANPDVKAEIDLAKKDASDAVEAIKAGVDKALGLLIDDVKPLGDGARKAAEAILQQLIPITSPLYQAVKLGIGILDPIAAQAEVPVDDMLRHGLLFFKARVAAIKI